MESLVVKIKQNFSPRVRPIVWKGDRLALLNQRLLPFETSYVELKTVGEVAEAIRNMTVRGAPAIGITAAFGMVLASLGHHTVEEALRSLQTAKEMLSKTRPTAVNLFWALDRMYNRAVELASKTSSAKELATSL
ncbi:MAG: S-methyl-5-thioribose-1-phosphate isomerase, partial [Pyrobaculum sp.]